ncbi:MAG: hypothetical protein R3D98_17865 [Candidatus Krumholzibacteriia bacterium]
MTQPLFTPFATGPETLAITPEVAARYSLARWADQFALGTAGYRDLLAPDDVFSPEVPFNAVSVAVMLAARAQLAVERGLKRLHVGGEVRPHTQELIDLAARLYAAQDLEVHLRPAGERTTPIWLSSFGVFSEELDGGENFTASHSQSYKGGWKPMDRSGGQLIEMAPLIAERVRTLVAQATSEGLHIPLAAADDPRIKRDFDPYPAYIDVLRQVVPADLIAEAASGGQRGFRACFCTEGGSMARAARRVFGALGIGLDEQGPVFFTHEQESSTYHGIGIVGGVDHGVDPGKWQVYKHVGAQEILRREQAHIFFIWDPDGDRFNMVTTAPAALAAAAREAGLEVDPLDQTRCLVYFKPNQIYFMLTAAKISALAEAGELDRYNWIVASTWPTSRSIGEVAESVTRQGLARLATFQVPVGFKNFAALVGDLERQVAAGQDPAAATDVTGTRVEFGPRPRLLIMAEESGGAPWARPSPSPAATATAPAWRPRRRMPCRSASWPCAWPRVCTARSAAGPATTWTCWTSTRSPGGSTSAATSPCSTSRSRATPATRPRQREIAARRPWSPGSPPSRAAIPKTCGPPSRTPCPRASRRRRWCAASAPATAPCSRWRDSGSSCGPAAPTPSCATTWRATTRPGWPRSTARSPS